MARKKPADDAPAVPEQGYTVLARRYRPQQFSDLVGQEPVAQALVNALKANRVAHAYLFTGARGVGKTSCARILAKALNCVKGPTPTPCDVCDNCKGIASGDDVDVLEFDAASNRGIDEVRDIRSNVQFRPSRARYKIYIIDEVHMLTGPAFNALLKTLEEPPPHVKFIFATTEVQKIPITILSRCQRFDFAGIGTPRIVERLKGIVQQEGMEADDDALELVARRAGGSMRDAQSLLDQLLAFGSDRLTTEKIHNLLGTAQDDRVVELANAVLTKNAPQALRLLNEALDHGAQPGELADQLIAYWRDLMVVHCAGADAPDLSTGPRFREQLSGQAKALKLDTILAGLDVLATTKARLRASSHGRTLLEMALVRLGRLEDLVSLSQLTQWLQQPGSVPAAAPSQARPLATAPIAPPEGVKKKPLSAAEPVSAPSQTVLSAESLQEVWSAVLGQLPPMLSAQAKEAGIPAISGPNTLVLSFGAGYNHQRDHCQAALGRIEEALRRVAGPTWQVRIESGGSLPSKGTTENQADYVPPTSRYRQTLTEAQQEPLIKRAMDVLGATLVRVDEGFGNAPAAPRDRDAPDDEEP